MSDWIKFEKSTLSKQEMMVIAAHLKCEIEVAVYLCLKWWCWCDSHLRDASIGMPIESVDEMVDKSGFCDAMIACGWIKSDRSGNLSNTNFERHFPQTAKVRADRGRAMSAKGTAAKKRYAKYRESPEWQAKRIEAIEYHGGECGECKATDALEVHHLHYKTLGKEDVAVDLRVLCRTCHQKTHDDAKAA